MVTVTKKKRANGNPGTSVNGIAEVEDLLNQLESFIKEAEALATMEIRRMEQMKEALKAGLVRVGAQFKDQFKEEEELLRSKNAALREMEQSFTAKIHDLENKLREKETHLTAHEASQENFDLNVDAANTPSQTHFTLGEQDTAPRRILEHGLRQGTQAGRQVEEESKTFPWHAPVDAETQGIDLSPWERGVKARLGKRPVGQGEKNSPLGSLLAPIKRQTQEILLIAHSIGPVTTDGERHG